MANILIVEDDRQLAEMVMDALRAMRYHVDWAQSGTDGLSRLTHYSYDLVVLDWSLPNLSGLEVCKSFRRSGGVTPIIMLTGRATIDDKEAGLDSGADDYLTKPFNSRELQARIRALLRRPSAIVGDRIEIANIVLDSSAHSVMVDGEAAKLLPKEFALLRFFMTNPNRLLSLEEILIHVWSHDQSDVLPAAVRKCVERLRQKVDPTGDLIETVRGAGYIFCAKRS